MIWRNKIVYWCRNKTLSERPILPSRENFWLFPAFKATFRRFYLWNILLRSNVVRVYCNYIYKVILCHFTFIFDLELMTLEKGKNAGIRPLFWQNWRLGGVLFRHITVGWNDFSMLICDYRWMYRTVEQLTVMQIFIASVLTKLLPGRWSIFTDFFLIILSQKTTCQWTFRSNSIGLAPRHTCTRSKVLWMSEWLWSRSR